MTPWTVAHQAPLSMEFSRQEYWSGLPFPSPGHLPKPGIKPASLVSPALAGGFFVCLFLPLAPVGKPTGQELCLNEHMDSSEQSLQKCDAGDAS